MNLIVLFARLFPTISPILLLFGAVLSFAPPLPLICVRVQSVMSILYPESLNLFSDALPDHSQHDLILLSPVKGKAPAQKCGHRKTVP